MNYRQVVQHYFRTIFGFVGVGVIATSGIGLCTLYLMIIATKMKILSSPFLFVFGDDRVTCHMGADDIPGDAGDA
ncbi:hypothetical protein DEO72_LG1g2997 [Vigna unguiculata]|uniref:Uncharacterized protein n=1 Tax=Vigna unguiculata TaxID=3917 RepID=A0A4D6KNV6_VIGUN|nr:hypothetical protein DEO72_LG1g2997 [Vigna unguiculata]